MFRRFCIKFPQSKMKGEQHRQDMGDSGDKQVDIVKRSCFNLYVIKRYIYIVYIYYEHYNWKFH
jgi:hypothetical protein